MYAALSIALSPLIWLYVHYRRLKGLDDQNRFKERFGYASLPRPEGRIVWFHSASVGETLSLRSFLSEWHARYPNDNILITTTTITAAKIVKDQFQGIAIHQFVPFDVTLWVNRFLNYWKPDQAFFVDSELWPNIVRTCKQKNIPLVLLNARLSDRSYKRWKCVPALAGSLLSQFRLCLAPGIETEERLKALGAKNVGIMANLKFSVPPLPVNQAYIDYFAPIFEQKHIWIAASTHPGEEELIFNVHQTLKRKLPNLITIIAPRHPHRAEALVKKASALGLTFQTLASALSRFDSNNDGFIVDEIGQLGTFYTLSDIVFMGGSLIPHGGHNPIEPAHFKKPVFYGIHMHNFREVCQVLTQAGVRALNNENELVEVLYNLFKEPEKRLKIGEDLYSILMAQQQSQTQLIENLWCDSANAIA
ncbi:MAG: 3-deoxy-D-manno-octulosonic acid transferase [Alphaproteobacteria bacterium]|nr:3-deoxy-D-manno-octulosonic acid transferase [Alphaproteobacteria bacterium]